MSGSISVNDWKIMTHLLKFYVKSTWKKFACAFFLLRFFPYWPVYMYLYTNYTKIEPNWAKNERNFCQPRFTRSINLCCKQLKTCATFQTAFNKNTFFIRHNVTCKSSCIIYLMERSLCKKSQYVGKSEYSLNLRINTLRNVWRTENPPCDKHFQVPGHNFNAHAKFTINEEVYNKPLSKLKIRSHREDREDRT